MRAYASALVWIGVLLVGATGCTTQDLPSPTRQPTSIGSLHPYQTPEIYQAPTLTPVVIIPLTPAPTVTPYMHQIAAGDTLSGIAWQYGVSLEALQAANPGIDPNFLPVGTGLVIPLGGEIQAVEPTLTPLPLDWSAPRCYPTGDGGAWCFLLVQNTRSSAVENLSAWIGLYDLSGEIIASQVAASPLNILRAGQALPLVAFFPPPLPAGFTARGELLTAVEIPSDDLRYLDWLVVIESVGISGDEDAQARVVGGLEPPSGEGAASQVWVLAVAYSEQGEVLGFRKWEAGSQREFDLTVYSLGGAIERVEVLAEIRP